jgi:hypothetical protein
MKRKHELKKKIPLSYKNSNIGWNDKVKREEMNDKNCRYLIALNNGKPIGFVMFQFTWEETMADDDDEIEVIYWYVLNILSVIISFE